MHEVGSEFALGMQPIPRLSGGLTNSLTHCFTLNHACNDFGSQATFSQRARPCRGTQVHGGNVTYRGSSSGFRCGAFGRASMAPPCRSAFIRIFVRDAWGDAHDLALASGMVRQPATASVSLA